MHHHLLGVEDEEEAEEDSTGEGEGYLEEGALDEQLQDTAHDQHAETGHEARKIIKK